MADREKRYLGSLRFDPNCPKIDMKRAASEALY
jgi:hypothetical protein